MRDNLRLARPGGVPDAEVDEVARSLSVDVLLLDEPTAHQDAAHAALVLTALAPAPGRAVVLSTHDSDVAGVASRRVELHPAGVALDR